MKISNTITVKAHQTNLLSLTVKNYSFQITAQGTRFPSMGAVNTTYYELLSFGQPSQNPK